MLVKNSLIDGLREMNVIFNKQIYDTYISNKDKDLVNSTVNPKIETCKFGLWIDADLWASLNFKRLRK